MHSSLSRPLHLLACEYAFTTAHAVMGEELLVRPFARRRVEQALRKAQQRTSVNDTAHLARLALIGDASNVAADDIENVRAAWVAWAARGAPQPRGLPVVLFAFLAMWGVLIGVGFAVHRALQPFDPSRSGIGYALRTNLTAYEVDVGAGRHKRAGSALERVFPSQRAELGGPTTQAFRALFEAYEAVDDTPESMRRLHAETRATNKQLADHAFPYYLDARLFASRTPVLYSYYLEREDKAITDGFTPERVVYLWRLDALNLRKNALGYTHRESDAAIVLYDQVEGFLIRQVLPALAPDEIVELVAASTRLKGAPWSRDIEARAARMVRESFHAVDDEAAVVRLGQLLAKRRAIVAKWSTELSAQSLELRPPTRLIPEADYVNDLWVRVPRASRDAWEEVHAELTSKEMTQTFERLRNRFATSVARHEVQHRIDGQRTRGCAPEVPCPEAHLLGIMARLAGVEHGSPLVIGTFAGRLWDETSAYLAEISDGSLPKMTILSLLSSLLDDDAYDGVYTNAALAVLTSLSDVLSLSDPAFPLVKHGSVQQSAVSSLGVLLFAKSDRELSEAAAQAWSKFYNASLARPTLSPVVTHKTWRH